MRWVVSVHKSPVHLPGQGLKRSTDHKVCLEIEEHGLEKELLFTALLPCGPGDPLEVGNYPLSPIENWLLLVLNTFWH